MAHASLPRVRHRLQMEQLKQISRWLLDGVGQALGFQEPADHPQPPAVGPQPFSGRVGGRQRRD